MLVEHHVGGLHAQHTVFLVCQTSMLGGERLRFRAEQHKLSLLACMHIALTVVASRFSPLLSLYCMAVASLLPSKFLLFLLDSFFLVSRLSFLQIFLFPFLPSTACFSCCPRMFFLSCRV
eukprot:m.530934 g.530934  ORF g.530934 m.530934 type:complete len:120 (-) comp57572_c0_seq10:51-410(-)